MTRNGQLRLGAFMTSPGQNSFAWCHPDVAPDFGVNLDEYARAVRIAERGKFDLIFLADNAGVWDRELASNGTAGTIAHFEPITLLSALAALTEHIGLVATATTSFQQPYILARQYLSLDHLSHGRAGWNVVTSANEAEAYNFGFDAHYSHPDRYRRAEEFVDIVTGLWDSFEDDAFVYDKVNGRFYDPDKLHVLHHVGEHYKVRGPMNVPRSPQGRPVIVQAGSSEAGIALGARTAEVVFTAQTLVPEAQRFYTTLKTRMADFDRSPDELKIMPGLFPIVGRTAAEAEDKYAALRDLVHIDTALTSLSSSLGGVDLSGYGLDDPMPDLPNATGWQSRQKVILEEAHARGHTLRETAVNVASTRGHHLVIGTAADVADRMQEWFEAEACDGFNVGPQTLPGGLADFVELVIPELQRRRLFRTEYEGSTLRDRLGLARPANSLVTRELAAR
jgi:FMN-dependent oxidoreductase (nitrilotriacetate monooxygenase family)